MTPVNVRATPSASGNRLGSLAVGQKVSVNGVSGSWSRISYGSQSGFVASRYLSDSPQQKPTPSIQNPDKGTGTSSGGGFRQQATSLLSRYGCGGSTLRIDDPRLPSHANGAYDFNTGQVLLKSSMPAYRMEYVVAHECMHQRQSRAYGGDINDLSRDMNAIYGGSGYTGLERNADCMTKSLGISVSNSQYASSCSGVGGRAAQAILAGKRP